MPALSPTTEAARVLQAMVALRHMTQGMTKSEACEQAGISVSMFDHWITQGGDAIESLQTAIVEAERQRIGQIANMEAVLFNRLLLLLDQISDPEKIVKVLKFLTDTRKDLESKHGVDSRATEADDYVLVGPTLRKEDSKMDQQHELSRTFDPAALSAKVKFRPQPDGSVEVDLPTRLKVIDHETSQRSEDE